MAEVKVSIQQTVSAAVMLNGISKVQAVLQGTALSQLYKDADTAAFCCSPLWHNST